VIEPDAAADDAGRDWFLRPKGGTTMTAVELKRKLRNSPFAPLQWRILFGGA
jgi:hypothetical protein